MILANEESIVYRTAMDDNERNLRLDQHEARTALEDAHETERAVRAPETPWWFFALNAILFAGLILTQLSEERASTFMAAVGFSIMLLNLLAARAAGVEGTTSRNRGFVGAFLLLFAVIFGSVAWYDARGEAWTVFASAAAAVVLVMVGGWFYRRDPS